MGTKEAAISLIREAFAPNEYPGDWCLKGSTEGDEPYLLEKEFKGKADWAKLEPAFLDRAPDGFSSALSFFSDEAFRFYLPAYLIADLEGQLEEASPVFHLCHGLDDSSRGSLINPRRYGGRTWFDAATCTLAMFSREEARAIVAYLELKRDSEETSPRERDTITQALDTYWKPREQEARPRAALHD